jgi:hypothetical protein
VGKNNDTGFKTLQRIPSPPADAGMREGREPMRIKFPREYIVRQRFFLRERHVQKVRGLKPKRELRE